MNESERAIARFWEVFLDQSHNLLKANSANNPAYDAVLDALHNIHASLFFEFASEGASGELIITTQGDIRLFPLADRITGAAPPTPAWTVHALKPKIGFPNITVWEGLNVAIKDVYFKPYAYERSRAVMIELHIRGLRKSRIKEAHNAVLVALDHGLGERAFAQRVQETRVVPFKGKSDPPGAHPIIDLEAYLDWHERQEAAR